MGQHCPLPTPPRPPSNAPDHPAPQLCAGSVSGISCGFWRCTQLDAQPGGTGAPIEGGSRSRLSFVLRALMPRQLHGKCRKHKALKHAQTCQRPHIMVLGSGTCPERLGTMCCWAPCAAGRCASAQRAPCAACRQPQERARTPRTVLQGQQPPRLLQALKHC